MLGPGPCVSTLPAPLLSQSPGPSSVLNKHKCLTLLGAKYQSRRVCLFTVTGGCWGAVGPSTKLGASLWDPKLSKSSLHSFQTLECDLIRGAERGVPTNTINPFTASSLWLLMGEEIPESLQCGLETPVTSSSSEQTPQFLLQRGLLPCPRQWPDPRRSLHFLHNPVSPPPTRDRTLPASLAVTGLLGLSRSHACESHDWLRGCKALPLWLMGSRCSR